MKLAKTKDVTAKLGCDYLVITIDPKRVIDSDDYLDPMIDHCVWPGALTKL